MQILDQQRKSIINIDTTKKTYINKIYGEDEEVNVIKGASINTQTINCGETLGKYKTEKRAQEVLLDIYAKMNEGKKAYKMPKE